jgi:DNA repair exonuclease SbcCD ATPase subunit
MERMMPNHQPTTAAELPDSPGWYECEYICGPHRYVLWWDGKMLKDTPSSAFRKPGDRHYTNFRRLATASDLAAKEAECERLKRELAERSEKADDWDGMKAGWVAMGEMLASKTKETNDLSQKLAEREAELKDAKMAADLSDAHVHVARKHIAQQDAELARLLERVEELESVKSENEQLRSQVARQNAEILAVTSRLEFLELQLIEEISAGETNPESEANRE